MKSAKRYIIKGQVQGVGFRPFVYKIAKREHLCGFVKNVHEGVELEVEGSSEAIEAFEKALHVELPVLARIDSLKDELISVKNYSDFVILQSDKKSLNATTLVSPDISTCKECLDDLHSYKKYHNYFAINCTNCGPRYSIIKNLPYDRACTSMSEFEMCQSCKEEYDDPSNRRFHAQPIACHECGPKLELFDKKEHVAASEYDAIVRITSAIKEKKIAAIKGVGGFHLVCDATDDEVVSRLREFKNRPSKPFAIMCKSLKQIKSFCDVGSEEERLLCSKESPIVILKKSRDENLSRYIAPKIERLGCFLPNTPLHHLLFEQLENPIVATSANLSNEPIISKKEEIFKKLPFVDFVLDFNREIVNKVDDSLVQVVDKKAQMLRLSRGYAPKVIKTDFATKRKILAVGANAKSSIALYLDGNIIMSPHIGDLDSLEAFKFFEETLETFKRFYDFTPELIVHDSHPNYLSSSWAKKQKIKTLHVQHHLAHIYACMAEYNLKGEYLGFSFDGTGYGNDGTLWGGEVFIGNERKYSFKPITLLGGTKAIKEPRRVALAMLFERFSLDEVLRLKNAVTDSFSPDEIRLLYCAYEKGLSSVKTSSVGRLFDAVASFSNLFQICSYEGESGLLCESSYDEEDESVFEYEISGGMIDLKIVDFFLKNPDKNLSSMLINTVVEIVLELAKKESLDVILSGGVFQNQTLLESLVKRFKEENITYYYQRETPLNDASIALGQLYYTLLLNKF